MEILNKKEKDKKYNIFFNNSIFSLIFKLLIFFSFIKKNLNIIFDYPKALTLLNGNILIIHKGGIDVYDSSLTQLLSSQIQFNESEKGNYENSLSKITISRFNENDYGLIIAIIFDRLYFFSPKGESLYIEDNLNNKYNISSSLYSLTPISSNNNNFTYMICFSNKESKVAPLFFKYNNNSKTNNLIKSIDPFMLNILNEEKPINNNGITCELMLHSIEGQKIVCFSLGQNSYLYLPHFFINPNTYRIQ